MLSTRIHDIYVKSDKVTVAVLSKQMWEHMNEEEPEVAWKLLRQMTAVSVLRLLKRRNLAFKVATLNPKPYTLNPKP